MVSFGKALKKHRVVIALFSGQGVYGQKILEAWVSLIWTCLVERYAYAGCGTSGQTLVDHGQAPSLL
jgi:hypothetical protein